MVDVSLFALKPQEESALATVLPKVDLSGAIDEFYQIFGAHPTIEPFFQGRDTGPLRAGQIKHWNGLINPSSRAGELKVSEQIGQIHERISVTPELYLAGYAFVFEAVVAQALGAAGGQRAALAAICKLLMADIASSLVSYVEQSNKSATNETAANIVADAVEISLSMNRLFVNGMKISQAAGDVDGRVNSISAAIQEMSATTDTINENAQEAISCTAQTRESSMAGQEVSDRAASTMGEIYETMEGTMGQVAALSESSRQIEGIITQIQAIAEQTNLLALNATIEAARAGEAGKGFAVVAGEVKSLANQTGKATEEIGSIVASFVASIAEIVEAMSRVRETIATGQEVTADVKVRMADIGGHAQQASDRIEAISRALAEQVQATQEIASATGSILEASSENKQMSETNAGVISEASEKVCALIANVASIVDADAAEIVIKLAKSDHVVWKRKLAELLMGSGQMSSAELKDHHQCRLGKWYDSEHGQAFRHLPAYQALAEPHARIHRIGREVYEHHQAKEYDAAFAKLDQMDAVSEEVLSLLDRLDQEQRAAG